MVEKTKHPPYDESCLRIVVTGSECTGKTTLTRGLAAKYGGSFSTEGVRDYVNDRGRPVKFSDVVSIARFQIAIEDAFCSRKSRLIFFDTDLFSTLIYSHLYFGRCPDWIEPLCRQRKADLYLLCGIDLPWVDDDFQRGEGTTATRQRAHNAFALELHQSGCNVKHVCGLNDNRLQNGISAIEAWMKDRNLTVDQSSKSP